MLAGYGLSTLQSYLRESGGSRLTAGEMLLVLLVLPVLVLLVLCCCS